MQYRTKNYAENVFDYFYFEKNLQGDVIGVYNASGTLLISYTYDAWGNCKYTYKNGGGSTGAQYNPFRYRGYFYDGDLGFYYLNNRYYDSVTGRFLNTDSYINANGDLLGFNLYAYCSNNPVMYVDPTGYVAANQKDDDNRNDVVPEAGGIKNAGTGPAATSGVGVAAGSISADTEPKKKDKKVLNNKGNKQKNALTVCFIAGTLVATENGLVPIEDIKPGDLVWATDEETGETALKEVVQLFRNETEEWVHVTVNGETITCTPEHPFYSPVKGWTNAIDLRAGDILVMLNGEYVVVEQVQHELLESPETTYNFEVEGFHTYYVGNTEVLVHNVCSQRAAMRAAKQSVNIPLSQQPTAVKVVNMIGQDGKYYFATFEQYGNRFIRNDWNGHMFRDGRTLPRHFNAGFIDDDGKENQNRQHFWY